MPALPQPYAHMSHLGSIPDGPQGNPEAGEGSGPDDESRESTAVLAGEYRNAPGADTFWAQNHLSDDTSIDPPVN